MGVLVIALLEVPATHRRADGLDDHHFTTLLTTHLG
jgi:hypothetical protein